MRTPKSTFLLVLSLLAGGFVASPRLADGAGQKDGVVPHRGPLRALAAVVAHAGPMAGQRHRASVDFGLLWSPDFEMHVHCPQGVTFGIMRDIGAGQRDESLAIELHDGSVLPPGALGKGGLHGSLYLADTSITQPPADGEGSASFVVSIDANRTVDYKGKIID